MSTQKNGFSPENVDVHSRTFSNAYNTTIHPLSSHLVTFDFVTGVF